MACEVDWTVTGTMLSGIGTWIGAAATAFGGIAILMTANRAADTFTAWKQQKREERRMELAEQTLAVAYKLKDSFGAIRSPASFGGEHDKARKLLTESDTISEGQDDASAKRKITAQITLLRISQHQPVWDQLWEVAPSVKAVFGDGLFDELEKFWTLRNKIVGAVQTYAVFRPRHSPSPEQAREDMEFERSMERAFWAMPMPGQPDEIADEIQNVICILERELAPIIRAAILTA